MSLPVYSTPSLKKYAHLAGMAFAIAVVSLLFEHPCLAAPPMIDSISPIYDLENQTITILGTDFGPAPTTDGFLDEESITFPDTEGNDFGYLQLTDLTDGDWAAGYGNDSIGLEIESWSDTEIVVGPFNDGYGEPGWTLSPGDEIQIEVWNSATGSDPDDSGTPQNAGALFDTYVAGTPEPPSILLMLSGLLGLAFLGMRKHFGARSFGHR